MTKPPPLFVREATGLVRQLGSLDVFVWSILYFPWLTSWAGIFWVTPSYYKNVNYYAALGVWAVYALVTVVLYWQLVVVMPELRAITCLFPERSRVRSGLWEAYS